jgi:hypothetical protein
MSMIMILEKISRYARSVACLQTTIISMISLFDNLQMSVSNNRDYYRCVRCKAEQAEVFHDSGDYCLECW